jgi:hypothetical protein
MIYNRLVALDGVGEVVHDLFDFSIRPDLKSKCNPYGPSVDQKMPGLGYTPENFQIVVAWYNHFKNDLTDGEALSILRNAHISVVQNASTT